MRLALKVLGSEPLGPVEGFVPDRIYREHERVFPQVTLDIVVTCRGCFLLVKRSSKNGTGRGLWATVGGHLRKNETLDEGASRILERETGIKGKRFQFLGVNQYFDEHVHCVSLVMKTSVSSQKVTIDETSSDYGWFGAHSRVPLLVRYYKDMLTLGGLHFDARRTKV
jgi:ADP-ribose pyrophosphatase YjhB (NUDIX family)